MTKIASTARRRGGSVRAVPRERSGPIGISSGDFSTPVVRKRTTTQPRGFRRRRQGAGLIVGRAGQRRRPPRCRRSPNRGRWRRTPAPELPRQPQRSSAPCRRPEDAFDADAGRDAHPAAAAALRRKPVWRGRARAPGHRRRGGGTRRRGRRRPSARLGPADAAARVSSRRRRRWLPSPSRRRRRRRRRWSRRRRHRSSRRHARQGRRSRRRERHDRS